MSKLVRKYKHNCILCEGTGYTAVLSVKENKQCFMCNGKGWYWKPYKADSGWKR